MYPEATLTIWQGYDHCERMTNDSAGAMAKCSEGPNGLERKTLNACEAIYNDADSGLYFHDFPADHTVFALFNAKIAT